MYHFFNTFLFRSPYFPYSALSDFKSMVGESIFKEMLHIATPDLSEGIDKGEDRAQLSAYRYYQRACTRPTPFGLFAGCSMGMVEERTDIQLLEQKEYKRVTRLDMNYICALAQHIEKDRNIRVQLHYYPNSSMYFVSDHLRYVEYYYQKTHRVHQITKVENSEYLQRVLALAKKGVQFTELVALLVNDEITMEEATEFIHELINSQVLVSELDPAITNAYPLTALTTILNGLSNVDKNISNILSKIESQLTDIDQQPIGDTNKIYPAIIKNIEKTKVETEIKYLFQADMFKPALHATISRDILKDIQQSLVFLNKITSSPTRTNLFQFKENFLNRYEEREMPLLFVLDNELGIGYADNTSNDISPLVDDLAISWRTSSINVFQSSIQSIMLQKYQQSSQKVIELIDEDVKGVEAVWGDLPLTFSVLCQILQDDERGRLVYLQSVSGQSAARLLGRFCHIDEQILKHTLAITEKEAQINPDVIFAEIVHLPESRLGNVLLRPVLRRNEIPYLAKTGVSSGFELSPDDLYISVKNKRIILRSKRLNKEIIPRMSTAHNYSGQNSMPVYHFLCDLQHQDGRVGLIFNWNETALQLNYLPRVVYKNCILSRARWTVRGKELKKIVKIKDDRELLIKIKEWQSERNIPDKVLLANSDNELYIDLNHPLSVRAWLSVVKKRLSFCLEEFLFDPATAVVHGPEGAYINEFIFAFYRKPSNKYE